MIGILGTTALEQVPSRLRFSWLGGPATFSVPMQQIIIFSFGARTSKKDCSID